MRLTAWRLLAIASLLTPAVAATRPHYGGTLRVQMKARVAALDPAEISEQENLAALVFDRLVSWSESGQPQPALATSWRHDADFKRWEFQLRAGVKFHDGSPFTASAIVETLKPLVAAAYGDAIVIRFDQPAPKLLQILASSSIYKRAPDGSIVGTGPFRVTAWEPSRRAVFAANEDYWAGRPYADRIEVEMGRSLRDQALDLDLNKADIIELSFGDTRRVMQNGKRSWTSPPVDLLALVFEASTDEHVREAVALSIDRATIHAVLLQKQGAPTGAILPQWLSGYAFLFPTARDLDRARQLGRGAAPVTLAYNPADMTARLIAERIAVNAHEAGLVIHPVATGTQAAAAHLIRTRVNWPDLSHALGSVAPAIGITPPADGSPHALYVAETELLRDHRIIPLFHLPEIYGLGPRVRGWAPSRWGGWNLDSVWVAQ
jgi:MarR-like DNA-binding transcriptional regulator SgrR of sgrS sRNA